MDARRPTLPPLDPDAYLAWHWRMAGRSPPMTVAEWAVLCGLDVRAARRQLTGMAAQARKNARLTAMGHPPDLTVGQRLVAQMVEDEEAF